MNWLCRAVEENRLAESSPIGFYFAKLWYYEKLYPLTFSVSALGHASRLLAQSSRSASGGTVLPLERCALTAERSAAE